MHARDRTSRSMAIVPAIVALAALAVLPVVAGAPKLHLPPSAQLRGGGGSQWDRWRYVDGALSDGFDAPGLPAANMTADAARAACASNGGCFGYSLFAPLNPRPDAVVPCIFRSTSTTTPSGGGSPLWQSFVRCGIESPCPPPPPCTPGEFAGPLPGFIGAGGDVIPAAMHTVADGKALCFATPGCLSITFASNSSSPEGQVNVYFKDNVQETDSAGWWTFLVCPAA